MTDRPRMSDRDITTFRQIVTEATFRTTMPFVPGPVVDVGGVLDWMGTYVRHVDKQVTRFRVEDMARAKADVVLRGLRADLARVQGALEDLDAQVEAGVLPVLPLLPADDTAAAPTDPGVAAVTTTGAGCECPPCPGRGTDGHGMSHCAECCFGTGVEADIACPIHGQPHATTAPTPAESALGEGGDGR